MRPMPAFTRCLPLKLHAECPECGEFRPHIIMQKSEGHITFTCENIEGHADAKAESRRGPHPCQA